jgi:glycosyltransferase involved in cell wall biosynthesis
MVVPGGVDRSGEYRVIPAVIAFVRRIAARHELHVFSLRQEREPGSWELAGARIHNIGFRHTFARGVRAILAEHRRAPFAVVHSIWSGSCGQMAVAAAMLARIPSSIHITGGEVVAIREIGYGGRMRLPGRLREFVLMRAATSITATSAPVIASLGELGVPAERLPLGVDLDRWCPRAPATRDTLAPARLLHIGTLNGVKDQPTLLRALALIKASGRRFHLDVVGDDILNGRIQAFAEQIGLANAITFHGFKTQGDLRALVEQAHLLVLSSLHEAGPYVLLEAAVVGVPTVGTRVGHIAEWAPEAALAVPVGDAEALARAIGNVLDDEPLRMRLAHNAQRLAVEEDAEHTARLFEAQYRDVIRRYRGAHA